VYKLLAGTPTSGEYFLVENRQESKFDAGIPGSGLLIWHIDASKPDNNSECYPGGPDCAQNHLKVALVQADNLWNLEIGNNQGDPGDPYPGSSKNQGFTDSTTPNSNLYSGNSSGVSITGISNSDETMTATLMVNRVPGVSGANQYRSNGVTAISEGGTTPEGTVVCKGTVTDPDGEQVKLQVELRQVTEAFTGTPTWESGLVSSGTQVSWTRSNLVNGSYKWRYRAVDARDLSSTWVEFGTSGNTDFVVAVASITVTAPNGGESWPVGSDQTIQWNSSGVTGNIRLDVSRNGGSTWDTLTYNTANDGSEVWRVTGSATTQARVRVLSVNNPSVWDVSDANFSIMENVQSVTARIDSYSPNDTNNPVQVQVGSSTTISVTFTNTGNSSWSFIAGATVWDSNGGIVGNYSRTVSLGVGQQTTESWSHTVNQAGDYWLQFGVWKDSQTLLDKKPSPSQRLIRGISSCPGKFCIGDTVTVSNNGQGLNLRQCGSTNNTTCPVITTMPDGTQMTVFGGPIQADGYTWWAISGYVNGIYRAGWASEHGLGK
jgi:hypothetical protein